MAPRTDFTPDYTPDFLPDGAASDGSATGALGTASVTLVAGTLAAHGTPVAGAGLVGGGRMRYRERPPRLPRAGRAVLEEAEVTVEAGAIHAKGTATAILGGHASPRLAAGTIRACGIQNLSDDDLLAVALLVADDA